MSESKSQAQGADFDFGTSPHGLPAELLRPHQEARPAEGSDSLADGFEVAGAAPGGRACEDGGRLPRYHYLELEDFELLHLVSAFEGVRNRTRKDIKKGLAIEADLECTNSLWQKLQEVMALRMRKEYGGWL
jgi:hypothetical protein